VTPVGMKVQWLMGLNCADRIHEKVYTDTINRVFNNTWVPVRNRMRGLHPWPLAIEEIREIQWTEQEGQWRGW